MTINTSLSTRGNRYNNWYDNQTDNATTMNTEICHKCIYDEAQSCNMLVIQPVLAECLQHSWQHVTLRIFLWQCPSYAVTLHSSIKHLSQQASFISTSVSSGMFRDATVHLHDPLPYLFHLQTDSFPVLSSSGCLGDAGVGHRTSDLVVMGSIPGPGVIGHLGQLSLPSLRGR